MLAIVLAAAALVAAVAAAGALWRRRSRRDAGLLPRLDPLPAGVKHLAASVSDLSDLGLHLHAARAAADRKPRLGALLDLRSH